MDSKLLKKGTKVIVTKDTGWHKKGTICKIESQGSSSAQLRAVDKTKTNWWISHNDFKVLTLKESLVDGQHVLLEDGSKLSYNEARETFDYTIGLAKGDMSMMLSSYTDDLTAREEFSVVEIFTPKFEVVTKTKKIVHYTRPTVLKVTQADIDAKFGCKTEVIS
jgi:hypothetical protein